MSLIKRLAPIAIAAVAISTVACTHDEEKIEEVVQAEPAQDPKNEFTVDKDTGKVTFKAEVVYFAFDDHTLTDEGKGHLNALADYLKKNKDKSLQIEGHADNRGSTEYNLALGQNRGESVRKYLETAGIAGKRLNIVSYGEERPALEGQGEDKWSKNRRAEFVMTAGK